MHETGYSGMVHWDNHEGWDGDGGGSETQDEALSDPTGIQALVCGLLYNFVTCR